MATTSSAGVVTYRPANIIYNVSSGEGQYQWVKKINVATAPAVRRQSLPDWDDDVYFWLKEFYETRFSSKPFRPKKELKDFF